jgi:hypothetical protein
VRQIVAGDVWVVAEHQGTDGDDQVVAFELLAQRSNGWRWSARYSGWVSRKPGQAFFGSGPYRAFSRSARRTALFQPLSSSTVPPMISTGEVGASSGAATGASCSAMAARAR